MAVEKVTYKDAGVDVERGYEAVARMKEHVKTTFTDEVLTDIGSFGGSYSIAKYMGMKDPVLVSGTDGVGTKLKLAFDLNKHDTIGIDCVAMCVNDILCSGAIPLFFLDYIATGRIAPEQVEAIVKGIATGCKETGCALIGGETAEMPGFYKDGEYDVAGFAVGIVDRSKMIDGSKIQVGDVIVGLKASGVHSNGYSLVRALINKHQIDLDAYSDVLKETYGEAFLKPTKLYAKAVCKAQEVAHLKAIAHITGGGFIENVPRMLKEGVSAKINLKAIEKLPVYEVIEELSGLEVNELYNTFNMGIGMMMVVSEEEATQLVEGLQAIGEEVSIIGEIVEGDKGVILCQD